MCNLDFIVVYLAPYPLIYIGKIQFHRKLVSVNCIKPKVSLFKRFHVVDGWSLSLYITPITMPGTPKPNEIIIDMYVASLIGGNILPCVNGRNNCKWVDHGFCGYLKPRFLWENSAFRSLLIIGRPFPICPEHCTSRRERQRQGHNKTYTQWPFKNTLHRRFSPKLPCILILKSNDCGYEKYPASLLIVECIQCCAFSMSGLSKENPKLMPSTPVARIDH